MASGSSGRLNNSGSKGFDFVSDDNILCSYDDFSNQESSNGNSDPVAGSNTTKDFQKSRMTRSSVLPSINVGNTSEGSLNQEVINTVERSMKKYADNLMRFLEGISSRLSQLELYCYNLDKSIGEMRSDLAHDHGEADTKLKFLEKHLQEVHRSVQILRDKQELAETQKELAKLQLAQKGSSQHEERAGTSIADSKKKDDVPDTQLALALPHQVAPHPSRPVEQQQQQPVLPASQAPPQHASQPPSYYLPSGQLPNPHTQSQPLQSPYQPTDQQFRGPQLAPSPAQGQVNQTPQPQQYPQYQQQWTSQVAQPVQPQQPQSLQPQSQLRAPSSSMYSSYAPGQPTNAPPETPVSSMPMQMPFPGTSQPRPEALPYGYGGAGRPVQSPGQPTNAPPETPVSSMPMQMPFPGASQPRPEALPYGYGGAGRPVQSPPPQQHMKSSYSFQPGDRYAPGPHPPISSGGGYMIYDGEGARPHSSQPPHFPHGGYPPANAALQNPQQPSSAGIMVQNPGTAQYVRNHPYNELIDKLVGMGYRGDHVASVIQRLEDGGQPVDFNAVLDRLNGHSSGGSQRGW